MLRELRNGIAWREGSIGLSIMLPVLVGVAWLLTGDLSAALLLVLATFTPVLFVLPFVLLALFGMAVAGVVKLVCIAVIFLRGR